MLPLEKVPCLEHLENSCHVFKTRLSHVLAKFQETEETTIELPFGQGLGKNETVLGKPKMHQVAMQTGASTPRVLAIKPKVYLTCTVRLPPKTWGRVTV